MSEPSRKPLAIAESRDPKSIRFAPAEWATFVSAARLRGVDPAAFVRDCSLMGLMIIEDRFSMEAYIKHLSVTRQMTGTR